MNHLTLNFNRSLDYFEKFKSDNLGLYFSFFLHFIILISAIGLPNFFGPKEILLPMIIPIEIINVTDVTSMPKEISDSKSFATKKIKIKEKKFNSSENQDVKKIDIKDKSKIKENVIEKKILPKEKQNIIIKEKKEIPKELEKQKIKIDTNKFESLPTKKIKPKLKPNYKIKKVERTQQSDVVIETKPKPKLKPNYKIKKVERMQQSDVVIETKPKPKPKLKPDAEFNVASMLKDLRNEKTTKKIDSDIEEKQNNIIEKIHKEKSSEIAQLSISERDLVLQQISRCFIAPAGAEINKTMFVKISAKIQPNRKVYENSIRIVDTNISKDSSVYGPITESAMRTLLNPECIPLKLPEEKYEWWKNLTMTFDYSVMIGN